MAKGLAIALWAALLVYCGWTSWGHLQNASCYEDRVKVQKTTDVFDLCVTQKICVVTASEVLAVRKLNERVAKECKNPET